MTVNTLTALESEALRMLLDGRDPVLLRLQEQASKMRVVERRLTGVGVFTDFAVSDDFSVSSLTGYIGDVEARVEGLSHGVGFVLFIREGRIALLEAFTYDEAWPRSLGTFTLRYTKAERDLSGLRSV